MEKHIDRRTFIKTTSFACAAGLLPLTQLSFGQGDDNRLNILLLVSEDHGPHMGCYGDKMARTPNLDQFASEGVRFNNAYVTAASCSPSRATILTGLFPQQHGQIGLSMDASTKKAHVTMKPETTTAAQILKQKGYVTGALGKIHVDPHETIGFDFRRGSDAYGGSLPSVTSLPVVAQGSTKAKLRSVRYSADIEQLTRDTAEFIAYSEGKPFFLMVNFSDAHQPWLNQVNGYPSQIHQPDEFTKPFEFTGESIITKSTQAQMAAYYNCLARLDASVGQILGALRKSGNADRTLVIFLSDHGPEGFSEGRTKTSNYEAGLKVPFLLKCPGKEYPQAFDGFVSSIDIAPTILEAAQVDVTVSLPGKSLLKVLDSKEEPHKAVYGDFNRHSVKRVWPIRSVRFKDWKLIYNPFAKVYKTLLEKYSLPEKPAGILKDYVRYSKMPEFEFYNLKTDPCELENLYADHQTTDDFQKCLGLLEKWQKDVGDYLLDPDAAARERQLVHDNIKEAIKA